MAFRVGSNVRGLEAVERLLEGMEGRAEDLRPVFRGPIDRHVTTVFRRQFDSRGAFGGRRWAPLTEATRRDKARVHRLGMGVLRRSNRLWASLTKSGGPDSVRVIDRDRYERGTSDPKARHHQRGATLRQWGGRDFTRPVKLPVRQLVPDPMPRSVVRVWTGLVEAYVARDED